MTVHPFIETGLGKAIPFGGCVSERLLRRQLFIDSAELGQGIGNFPEGGLDRLFVPGHHDVAINLGYRKVRRIAPAVKDRQRNARGDTPGKSSLLKKAGQLITAETDGRNQRYFGEKRCPCRSDIGVGTFQLPFGLEDIGTAQQYVRCQAG